MRKILIMMALSLVLVFGMALNAMAFEVTYAGTGNFSVNVPGQGSSVFEEYGFEQDFPDPALTLIPWPSHDGFAVVDQSATPSIFLDKVVTFDPGENTTTTWHADNNTPFDWSDYHFELWNEDFTARATGVTFDEPLNSDDFKNPDFLSADGLTLTYYNNGIDPGSRDIKSGERGNFVLSFDFDTENPELTFGLRQIATAVPVPPSALLLGSALLGLGVLRWRRK